jgi:hypothetical protein
MRACHTPSHPIRPQPVPVKQKVPPPGPVVRAERSHPLARYSLHNHTQHFCLASSRCSAPSPHRSSACSPCNPWCTDLRGCWLHADHDAPQMPRSLYVDDLPHARPRDPTCVGPEVLPACSHTSLSPAPTTMLPQRRTNMVQPRYTLPSHTPDDYRVRQWRPSKSVSIPSSSPAPRAAPDRHAPG